MFANGRLVRRVTSGSCGAMLRLDESSLLPNLHAFEDFRGGLEKPHLRRMKSDQRPAGVGCVNDGGIRAK